MSTGDLGWVMAGRCWMGHEEMRASISNVFPPRSHSSRWHRSIGQCEGVAMTEMGWLVSGRGWVDYEKWRACVSISLSLHLQFWVAQVRPLLWGSRKQVSWFQVFWGWLGYDAKLTIADLLFHILTCSCYASSNQSDVWTYVS